MFITVCVYFLIFFFLLDKMLLIIEDQRESLQPGTIVSFRYFFRFSIEITIMSSIINYLTMTCFSLKQEGGIVLIPLHFTPRICANDGDCGEGTQRANRTSVVPV